MTESSTSDEPRPAGWAMSLFDGGGVTAFELHGRGNESWLLPAEAAHVAQATSGRRAEYAAGRQCARAALDALGMPRAALLPAADRSPRWPAGVVGSITHTGDYCLAVARRTAPGVAGLEVGVDAERIGRVRPELHRLLFTDAERADLEALPDDQRSERSTALFAAKEAFYKAQYSRTRSWLGFHEVELSPAEGGLLAWGTQPTPVLDSLLLPQFVHCVRRGPLVVAAVSLPSGGAES